MKVFLSLLCIAGILAIIEPFLYLYGKWWYGKNPGAENNYKFEELKMKFEHKEWTVWVSLAVGSAFLIIFAVFAKTL